MHSLRMRRNLVNLGRLYSSPQGIDAAQGLKTFGPSLSNIIGNTPSGPGWAYFEDGSVYISSHPWLSHSLFEARMKLTAPFCLQGINNSTDESMNRLIIFTMDNRHTTRPERSHIQARHARDGQKVFDEIHKFKKYSLRPGPNGDLLVTPRDKTPKLTLPKKLEVVEALKFFRGTLVEGALQPNTRPRDGLQLTAELDAGEAPQKPPAPSENSVTKQYFPPFDRDGTVFKWETATNHNDRPTCGLGASIRAPRGTVTESTTGEQHPGLMKASLQNLRSRPRSLDVSPTHGEEDCISHFNFHNPAPPAALAKLRRRTQEQQERSRFSAK
ncbi:hypothetical protein T440DRAFT_15161 [Plenodomus tracheiphilus IPT5]|uniref:Uncharacterized protein n=1 Tax=Plenodomus tracheiphilus IPT5 TaxID=1408161 RepID=A0A6A7BNQ0_9PLEO|nr:hypothetical protein T440DRAFT_15161 [Plenodomus tracheiphilus IPT5]